MDFYEMEQIRQQRGLPERMSDPDRELYVRRLRKAEHDYHTMTAPFFKRLAWLHTCYAKLVMTVDAKGLVTTHSTLTSEAQREADQIRKIIAYYHEVAFKPAIL